MIRVILLSAAAVATSLNAGDIAKLYQQQEGESAFRSTSGSTSPDSRPPTQKFHAFGIERSGGWPASECYEARINGDGKVVYRGYRGVKHRGVREGKLHPDFFEYLSRLASELRLMGLPTTHYRDARDTSSLYLYLFQGNREKVIWCERTAAPATLWAVGAMMDKVLEKTNWEGDKTRQELMRQRLSESLVMGFECDNLQITEAYDALRQELINMCPDAEGARFIFEPPALPPREGYVERRVTVKFGKVLWLDAIEILCRVAWLSYRIEDDWVVIEGDRYTHNDE